MFMLRCFELPVGRPAIVKGSVSYSISTLYVYLTYLILGPSNTQIQVECQVSIAHFKLVLFVCQNGYSEKPMNPAYRYYDRHPFFGLSSSRCHFSQIDLSCCSILLLGQDFDEKGQTLVHSK